MSGKKKLVNLTRLVAGIVIPGCYTRLISVSFLDAGSVTSFSTFQSYPWVYGDSYMVRMLSLVKPTTKSASNSSTWQLLTNLLEHILFYLASAMNTSTANATVRPAPAKATSSYAKHYHPGKQQTRKSSSRRSRKYRSSPRSNFGGNGGSTIAFSECLLEALFYIPLLFVPQWERIE